MKLWRYQYPAGKVTDISLNPARNYWLQVVKGDLKVNGTTFSTSDAAGIRAEDLITIETGSEVEFLLFDLR